MKKLIQSLFVAALFALPSALAGEADQQELMVFAAASLTDAFKNIGTQFEEQNKGTKVTFSFGASNQLRLQIEQGAAADVFASANMKEMETLAKGGLVAADKSQVFARNRLVVLVPKQNPGKIESLKALAKPGIKLVIAHENVPVGKYALEMLAKASAIADYGADFKDKVAANVVSKEENVKAVVSKVQLGNADAGIAYVSDVTEKALKEVSTVDVPDNVNLTATYPIAPLQKSKMAGVAASFVAFVLSENGQKALMDQRFLPGGAKLPAK
jgi:molybdate transport system substrate-binding protein